MTDTHDGQHVVVQEQRQETDPVTWWLTVAIILIIVTAVTGILFALIGGYLTPKTPRTLVESQLVLLRNAAVTYPTSGSARQAYILALEQSGQTGAANTEYKVAIKQVSGLEKTPVYVAGVTLLFDSRNYKGALALAKEGLATDRATRDEMIRKALQNDAVVTDAQFDNKARIALLLTSARASGSLGDWQSAVKSLTDALTLDPTASDLLTYRASAYANLGQKDKAIADYKTALSFYPDDPQALAGLKQVQGK